MKINWKARFRNKVFLFALAGLVVSFVFDLLAMFEVIPAISESMVMQLVDIVLLVLTAVGVVTDPTTPGLQDSDRAMTYVGPGVPGDNG